MVFVFIFASLLYADLIEVYKKKNGIMFVDDQEFKNIDLESLFYDNVKHIAAASDGSIFVSNSRQHNIYKFENGNLTKTFGTKGQGPGDLLYPGAISILDERYLIAGEYALNRRISVFDLNGRFLWLVKTHYPVFFSTALKNNKIAILNQNSIENKKTSITTYKVIIRDIKTAEEINVASFIQKKEKNVILTGSYYEKVYLSRINNSDLLVGYSLSPEIFIYSSRGEKIRSSKINVKQKKISQEMKEEFYQIMDENVKRKPFLKRFVKNMRSMDIFPEYIPYYRNIVVDSENNILIFKHSGFDKINNLKFQIYDNEGTYLFDSKFDFGEFKPKPYPKILFKNVFLYSLLERKNSDDIFLQIVRVKLK
jgi:hypothetical protein